MTERVTIEGERLVVTTTAPDPKRRRPPPYDPPTIEHTGRTLGQIMTDPNPYWSDEENAAAERKAHYD